MACPSPPARVVSGTTGICSSARASPHSRDDFPKSWDELRRLSKEFTVWKGDTLEVAGFIPWHAVEDLATWSALNGSQLYDAANRKYTIDAEPNVAMMEYALDWLNQEYKGDFARVIRSGNWEGYEIEGRQPAFIDQRQAMFLTYSWNMGLKIFAQSAYAWNMARLPVGPGGTKSRGGILAKLAGASPGVPGMWSKPSPGSTT